MEKDIIEEARSRIRGERLAIASASFVHVRNEFVGTSGKILLSKSKESLSTFAILREKSRSRLLQPRIVVLIPRYRDGKPISPATFQLCPPYSLPSRARDTRSLSHPIHMYMLRTRVFD